MQALPTDTNKVKATKWGTTLSESGIISDLQFKEVFVDLLNSLKTVSSVENPNYNPDKPEGPLNPKLIAPQLEAYEANKMPDPTNVDKALEIAGKPILLPPPGKPAWDTLVPVTQSYIIGNKADALNNRSDKLEARVLFNYGYYYFPATLTVERKLSDVKIRENFNNNNTPDSSGKKTLNGNLEKNYREKDLNNPSTWSAPKSSTQYNWDDETNYKQAMHHGSEVSYRKTYTFTLKFDNIYDYGLQSYIEDSFTENDAKLIGDTFQVTFNPDMDQTKVNDPATYYYTNVLNPYAYPEKHERVQKYLEFTKVEILGELGTKDEGGKVTVGAANSFKYTINCADVLNKQTHFFIPIAQGDNKYVNSIDKIVFYGKDENVLVTATATGFTITPNPASREMRFTTDNATSLDLNSTSTDPNSGYFDLGAIGSLTLANVSPYTQYNLVFTISGLEESTSTNKEGKDRSSNNYTHDDNDTKSYDTTEYLGYSFVVHFGL